MRDTATRSRTWWAFAGFIVIAGFFLFTEHRAHLFGVLPFVFLLACPFLHMFGHGGHGGHGGRQEDDNHSAHSSVRDGDHQRPSGTTRDDWRS